MLIMKNVSKTFNPGTVNEKCALKNLNLELKDGDFATIIGSNGAGKSTLFNAITGAFFIDRGLIVLDGEDITYQKEHVRSKVIGHLFQDPLKGTAPHMTIEENMALAYLRASTLRHEYFSRIKTSDKKKFREQLSLLNMGLEDRMKQPVGLLSGGQRQRIGIARSLATNPKFVVCDEAVSALDVSIQSQIINLLSDLKEQQNLTYLFITHDLSVVRYISDRIGVMYLGNMVEQAESQELFDHPLHPYTEALLGAIPTTNVDDDRELVILEGDIPSPVNPPKGCKFHTRCKYCTDICKMVTPEMEEVRPNHFVACHHILKDNL